MADEMNERRKQREEALTQALYLVLTAPTDGGAQDASELAEKLAARLDPVTVERAKSEARRRVDADQN